MNPNHLHRRQAHTGGFLTADTADAGKVRLCAAAATLTAPLRVSKTFIGDAISTLTGLTADDADDAARQIAAAITSQLRTHGTLTLHGLGSFTIAENGNHFRPVHHCDDWAEAALVFQPDPALLKNL